MATSTETTLRGVIEPLAELTRRAGSADERRAAELLVDAFADVGATARIEDVPFRDGYAALLLPIAAVGVAVGLAAGRGGRRRPLAGLLAAAATAALIDDVENAKRVWRRAVTREQTTTNV